MTQSGRWRRDEAAASDFVSTILLVALVVVVGAVFAVLVSSTLSAPPVSESSFALVTPHEGDEHVEVVLRQGAPLELRALKVVLVRNGTILEVPRDNWTTFHPDRLLAGGSIRFAVTPPVGAEETLRVRLIRTDANFVLSELGGRVGKPSAALDVPALNASIEPRLVPADGATLALLAVRVSHPAGALAIGTVVADTSEVARTSGSTPLLLAMRDDGTGGDAVGGDGVWSTTYAVPTRTVLGKYNVTFSVIDAMGRPAGSVNASFEAVSGASATPPSTGASGAPMGTGTAFSGPTSENLTSFRLKNWTWDRLHPQRVDDDVVTVRIAGGGESWSARISLTEQGGTAYATELLVWNNQHETVYKPRNGTLLALAGLEMDLMNPVGSLQWVRASGANDPLALYPNAGITVRPTFVVPYFGQDVTTGNTQTSTGTGIISVEVVFI